MTHNSGITPNSAQTAAGALSIDGLQPVWLTLNEARHRAFTGEVVFELDPEVFAYFDHGVVYYAERARDVSLGRRLVESGMLDVEQLERGTVRVGDVEHLGRLFDRDPSVDRDGVLVAVETSTENLIADLANREIAAVRVTAYRHHPSGVHRWFVAPVDAGRRVSLVAERVGHPAAAFSDELTELALPGFEGEELTIEWDESVEVLGEVRVDPTPDLFGEVLGSPDSGDVFHEPFDEAFEYVFEDDLDEVIDEAADEVVVVEPLADLPVDRPGAVPAGDDDVAFAVVWPDGTEDITPDRLTHEPSASLPNVAFDDQSDTLSWPADAATDGTGVGENLGADDENVAAPNHGETIAFPEPSRATVARVGKGEVRFEIPDLSLGTEPSDVGADVEVADEVADAVRRAILAIESATVDPTTMPDALAEPTAPDALAASPTVAATGGEPVIEWLVDDAAEAHAAPVERRGAVSAGFGSPTPAADWNAFAPPTMNMRAEVLYGIEEADTDATAGSDPSTDGATVEPAATTADSPSEVAVEPAAAQLAHPEHPELAPGVASVVFVDDDAETSGGSDERASSLRRLIGSLRRRDY